MKSKNRELA